MNSETDYLDIIASAPGEAPPKRKQGESFAAWRGRLTPAQAERWTYVCDHHIDTPRVLWRGAVKVDEEDTTQVHI